MALPNLRLTIRTFWKILLYRSSSFGAFEMRFFTRLSDFDDMDDIQMLRQPGISRRIINAVRSERALIGIKHLSR
nr:hypothetical protein REQ54_04251 [Rhizobium sp. Q54]